MKKLLLLLMLLPFFGNSQEWLKEKTLTDWRAYTHSFRPDAANLMDVEGVRLTKAYYLLCEENQMSDNIEFCFLGESAIKTRTSTIYDYIEKLYDLSVTGDGTQTTESNQPTLTGNIAPTERKGIKNPNGGTSYITHPEISFSSTDAWSVTTCLKWDGTSGSQLLYGTNTSNSATSAFYYNYTGNQFIFVPESGGNNFINLGINKKTIGKNNTLSIIANGSGNLSLYVNGELEYSGTITTDFKLNCIFNATTGTGSEFDGSINAHIIRNIALTPAQVTAEAEWLQTVYPEIPTVQIDGIDISTSNIDAVATCEGTAITNVTDNATWAGLSTAAWDYHSSDSQIGSAYGKLYNGYARDQFVTDIATNGAWGYHISTEAELTTLAANGGYALKKEGTDYWTTTGGTNFTEFTALGSATRSDVDGTFTTLKNSSAYWCADSDKVLLLNHADNTATITVVDKKYGASIRLVKD